MACGFTGFSPAIRMGSRALVLLGATATTPTDLNLTSGLFTGARIAQKRSVRSYSARSGLPPPDLPRLAEIARISLTPEEIEEFAPKIQQVVDWFGQLQAVDLESIQPAIRADTESENLRGDVPETFENREAMVASIPSYEEPFIKVPKVLNKE
ncbi:glutamyl-tRNA(Gln) amidotransferase subunit C, chloroplastic/mitochondrial [Diospyros lotus]|uniref:glutamyl-tRNA(Gln) amidotransferase subunit C, chloroplastic/mitochondrial n=1 Tax=Diospyros lotus TaxID=55363 RepID=UPI00225B2FC4|nr:glutamyl-tRNA(Gln) amidotransferase subunit C, chloroplastic/mitochondrial [Diospyros lotus]XP_052211357.1 glutamyl-tRNA(Gln) amidotransferase subunit C, chloroplastic/mitochondrial [Diospyros lotus]XP_052211358.1 glutamyl-tRNA(Gln) amidotransferase subunit C, chloroplastic/mitochondrial [Diospyros lotus]